MQTNLRKHQQEGPLVITRGDGCRVYDNSGREYIESIAGLWCASLGFASERLAKVAYEQMRSLAYYHLLSPSLERTGDRAGGGATQNRAGANGPRPISVFWLRGERYRR